MTKKYDCMLYNDWFFYPRIYAHLLEKVYLVNNQYMHNTIRFKTHNNNVYYRYCHLNKGCVTYDDAISTENFENFQIIFIDEPKLELKRITKWLFKYAETENV